MENCKKTTAQLEEMYRDLMGVQEYPRRALLCANVRRLLLRKARPRGKRWCDNREVSISIH